MSATEAKRLYRSRIDRMVAGVAGGLGQYFDIDPLVIRILFVVFAVTGGSGIFLYALAWMFIPEEPISTETYNSAKHEKNDESKGETVEEKVNQSVHETKETNRKEWGNHMYSRGRNMGGFVLIALGAIFLIENLTSIDVWGNFWPVILIVIGLGIMVRRNDKE